MQNLIKTASDIYNEVNVPTIPEELIKLREELTKKYPNTVTIANLIAHNPELLVNFIKLVNTNITSEQQEIKDAKAAVNLLGLDEIYNIFLSSSMASIIAQNETEKKILLHGAQAGLAAAELSYWVFDVSRSEAYMAGLMQNIGAVFLSRKFKDEYDTIFTSQLSYPITGYKNELNAIGTTHCIMGGIISKRWNISGDVYKSILFHHELDFALHTQSNQKIMHLTALTILANYIVSSVINEQYITEEMREYRNAAKKCLSLPDNAFSAANAAVLKWGNNVGLVTGSH